MNTLGYIPRVTLYAGFGRMKKTLAHRDTMQVDKHPGQQCPHYEMKDPRIM